MNSLDLDTFPTFQPVPVSAPKVALIVDDDPNQLEVLAFRMEQLGYRTEKLGTGSEVVSTVHRLQPHIVLLDIELPDVNGLDICATLNEEPSTSEIPVVLISGTSRTDVVRAARLAGSRFFVHKPYDPNALMLIVDAAVQDSRDWL